MNATAKKQEYSLSAKKINTKIIKKAMIDKEMTLIDAAKLLDVNVNTISRWVNNNNLNQIENFLKLMTILNLEIKDIYK